MKNAKEIIVLICCYNLVFPAPVTMAAPQGGKVVGGSAHIHQSGATTTINQSSNRAVINWNSFDIAKNETVRHNMPSANSAGLHRVVGGGGASQIMGQLQSNGNVYLVNPAGVVIHKGARIDTNSFTATSRDISNDNFMKGNMVFDKPGRPDAEVINQGTISVKENGLAALVAPTVRNDGVIAGKLAKVALASGDSTWKLDMHGDDLITFTVDEKDVDTLHAVDGTPLAGVENSGSIKAEGGVVVLTAAQLDGIVGSVVNSGEVSAASTELKGGKIVFKGAGSGVDIVNTGTVDASSAVADGGSVRMDTDGNVRSSGLIAATGGQKGGKVVVTGKDVALTGTAKIDVSGNKGGGTALVGGNALGKGPERNAQTTKVEKDATIVADARTKGDGGQVVVWSDEKTNFDGTITARGGSDGGNGGKVETSGKSLKVGDTAQVDTRASKGIHGQWLLDPMDFVIAESGGDMTGAAISANLELGDVTIKSDSGSSGTNGDIFVNDVIAWRSDTKLTLHAERNVDINNVIKAIGDTAGLHIEPRTGEANIYSKIILSGTSPTLSIHGKQYNIINSIENLQNIKFNPKGYYALGTDIDASVTNTWNDGLGFDPIGEWDASGTLIFSGVFNGLGHTINHLYINRPDETHVGLFGFIQSATISNVGLNDVSIIGGNQVGGLAGCSYTTDINNCYVIGKIAGNTLCGGLAGRIYGGNPGDDTSKHSIINCFSNVELSGIEKTWISSLGSDLTWFGGIAGLMDGMMGLAKNLYSAGYVPSYKKSGGLLGEKNYYMQVINSYFDKETSNLSTSAGGIGLSTADMKKISTYSDWDFANHWAINIDSGYPVLKIFTSFEPSLPESGGSTDPGPTPTPNPDPTPDPGPDGDPAPTPDPDPDLSSDPDDEPAPDPDTTWPNFNPDPDSDIDPVFPEHDKIQGIVNGLNPNLELFTDNLTQIVTFSQDYLPDVFINVLKKEFMIKISSSLISSISQFLAGNPASFLKELTKLAKDLLNYETIDMLLRMKWTADCLNKSKFHIEQAITNINKNTIEGTLLAIENIKIAHEYKTISLLLSEKEYEDVLERSEKTFFENALTNSGEIALELGGSILGNLVDKFAGPAVKSAITETNGVVAGIAAEFIVKHGKDIAEFEKFIMMNFETPNSLKSIVENMEQTKMYDTILQKVREIAIQYTNK